jgi:hypothetical protein
MNNAEWVVYCDPHGHYLEHVSAGGTTWTHDPDRAKRYPDKPAATEAADKATWLDHLPRPMESARADYIARAVADAPPLDREQRAGLARLLGSVTP